MKHEPVDFIFQCHLIWKLWVLWFLKRYKCIKTISIHTVYDLLWQKDHWRGENSCKRQHSRQSSYFFLCFSTSHILYFWIFSLPSCLPSFFPFFLLPPSLPSTLPFFLWFLPCSFLIWSCVTSCNNSLCNTELPWAPDLPPPTCWVFSKEPPFPAQCV